MFTPLYSTSAQAAQPININCFPGRHDEYSPVLGARFHELKGLHEKIKTAPILAELEQEIYYEDKRYRQLIPYTHQDQGDALAKKIFEAHIDPYRQAGLNEDNIVQWLFDCETRVQLITDKDGHFPLRSPVKKKHVLVEAKKQVKLSNEGLAYNLLHTPWNDKYLPAYLAASHEIRHLEEWSLSDQNWIQWTQEKVGTELLTTLQDIIYCDSIYKQLFGIAEIVEVNHDGKLITLKGNTIPIGKLANFYRELSVECGSLWSVMNRLSF